MKLFDQLPITAVSISALLICSCASGPLTVVPESKRDTTGEFDGRWTGTITNTPARQQSAGNVGYMRCGDRTGRRIGPITIKDGQARLSYAGESATGYVNSRGGFKLVIPVKGGGFSGGSASFVANKDTHTISGSFQTGKGSLFASSLDLGGAGCNSTVAFKKV